MRRIVGGMCLGMFLLGCAGSELSTSSGDIPDGQWELIRLEYDGQTYEEPLILSSTDQLIGGRLECNDFGQQANGDMVQTLQRCEEPRMRIDDALIDAVKGDRRVEGDQLVLDGSFATAVLRSITLPTPAELFSILASDEPDIDPSTLLLDEEAGGPPQDWDRMIRLDDDDEVVEFVIGSIGGSVCFHIGIASERVTSGSTCRSVQDVRFEAVSMTAGYPPSLVRAALIPDAFLVDEAIARLKLHGILSGNLFIASTTDAINLTLSNEDGDYHVRLGAA